MPKSIDAPTLNELPAGLEVRWVPVQWAKNKLYRDNSKLHDIGKLSESIARNGFRDPAGFDSSLPAVDGSLGAIAYGNGRVEALLWMEQDKTQSWAATETGQLRAGIYEAIAKLNGDQWIAHYGEIDPGSTVRSLGYAPKGITVDPDGVWWMPLVIGVDSTTKAEAEAFVLDHNLLTMAGGNFTALDMSRMFDQDALADTLQRLRSQEEMPIAFDADDLDLLISQMTGALLGVSETDSQTKEIDPDSFNLAHKCPKCGFEFDD